MGLLFLYSKRISCRRKWDQEVIQPQPIQSQLLLPLPLPPHPYLFPPPCFPIHLIIQLLLLLFLPFLPLSLPLLPPLLHYLLYPLPVIILCFHLHYQPFIKSLPDLWITTQFRQVHIHPHHDLTSLLLFLPLLTLLLFSVTQFLRPHLLLILLLRLPFPIRIRIPMRKDPLEVSRSSLPSSISFPCPPPLSRPPSSLLFWFSPLPHYRANGIITLEKNKKLLRDRISASFFIFCSSLEIQNLTQADWKNNKWTDRQTNIQNNLMERFDSYKQTDKLTRAHRDT